jgi:hypothetical protein
MHHEPEDPVWQRLSKALFGVRQTTDEGLFTYRVMEEVRKLQPALQDLAWSRFLRWAVPALGVGVASLVLATRTPTFSIDESPLTISTISMDYP